MSSEKNHGDTVMWRGCEMSLFANTFHSCADTSLNRCASHGIIPATRRRMGKASPDISHPHRLPFYPASV